MAFWLPVVASLSLSQVAAAGDHAVWFHQVRPGEVAGQIAQRHQLRLVELARANPGQDLASIRVGQRLVVPRVHEVELGEVLGQIARRYGATLSSLERVNGLQPPHTLRPGQKLLVVRHAAAGPVPDPTTSARVPTAVVSSAKALADTRREPTTKVEKEETFVHRVRAGEVLGAIARRYAVSVQQLLTCNDLGSAHRIRIGERLRIPITSKNSRFVSGAAGVTSDNGGYVRLEGHGKSFHGYVLGPGDRILPAAQRGIGEVLAAWRNGKKRPLDPRLMRLIARVSAAFGGRPIRVVSGYRQQSYAPHSKHKTGQALDFSVPGVPNSVVRDYLLELPDVGVGYYPNSTHVHVDVRGRRSYWVDYSGPGAPPRYQRNASRPPVNAVLRPPPESRNQS